MSAAISAVGKCSEKAISYLPSCRTGQRVETAAGGAAMGVFVLELAL